MNNLSIIENGLIPVYQSDKGTKLVNMRELHAWLEVGRDFSTWVKDRIEKYDFIENQDFMLFTNSGENSEGRPRTDYIFKLEPAKEIAMVENNEKGKEIRRYFIKVEEKFKQQSIDYSKLSPELQMVSHLLMASAKLEAKVERLETTTQTIKDTMAELPKDQWRKWVNSSLGEIGIRLGNKGQNHEDLRSDSYKLLEEKAGADLSTRLRNGRKRLEDAGATKTAQKEYCKLDCIEEDKRLKEIYTGIIKELRIKHLA
jgi:phage anti-repressor protein/ribosome-associated translation inhibitor RaiA